MQDYKKHCLRLAKARVLVVGDLMLDRFVYGDVARISQEAPVPVVHVRREEQFLGGAGNVARTIAALGATAGLVGVIGKDREAQAIVGEMEQFGIAPDGLVIDTERPTITKTRIIAGTQQVVRIDNEDAASHGKAARDSLIGYIERNIGRYDGIIISDYAKGVITRELITSITKLAKKNRRFVLVDPSVKHFGYYKGVTSMTPNLKEAAEGARREVDANSKEAIAALGRHIKKTLALPHMMITLGPQGMAILSNEIKGGNPFFIPTKAKAVYDVSGAGDTVIAVLAMGLAVGLPFLDASFIANYAAGVVVGKRGTATLSMEELIDALNG
ncbi:MAG: D-glycero-beta-D-manno-heptose-7-phosphate kinase [Spirochaetes bacterium]|nr:D-glycero-beta-D-manno-heptose-7-phosphate kinase [Spirochaetota bacterium]